MQIKDVSFGTPEAEAAYKAFLAFLTPEQIAFAQTLVENGAVSIGHKAAHKLIRALKVEATVAA